MLGAREVDREGPVRGIFQRDPEDLVLDDGRRQRTQRAVRRDHGHGYWRGLFGPELHLLNLAAVAYRNLSLSVSPLYVVLHEEEEEEE